MPSVEESMLGRNQLAATLVSGLETLDFSQVITFTKYVRVVLPLDGFVFWVRADLLALPAGAPFAPADAADIDLSAAVIACPGSLHYASMLGQTEDESLANRRVVFTSELEIQDFNQVSPSLLFVGEWEGVRFAFSQRSSFYRQADLHHYIGDAIYPAMQTQIVDDLAWFDNSSLVVSNSLPIWLSFTRPYAFPGLESGIGYPIFPSFAVPQNQAPPYASVHIFPESTQGMQLAPFLDRTLSHFQLCQERVRITLYGLRDAEALWLLDYVTQFTLMFDVMGVMNIPVVRDEKRTQTELGALAMKKTIEFQVNYNQAAVRQIARQFILHCIPTLALPS
jgi:hypothetical protein